MSASRQASHTGLCRDCRQEFMWVRLPAGNFMPVDPEIDLTGNVAAMRDGTGTLVGHVISRQHPAMPYERLYRPHAATCTARKATAAAHTKAVADGTVVDLAAARSRRRALPPRPARPATPVVMNRSTPMRSNPRAGDIGEVEREVQFEPLPDAQPVQEPQPDAPDLPVAPAEDPDLVPA